MLTLALNTADSIAHARYGTALVDSVGPVLLIGWAEVGPWLLRQVHGMRLTSGALADVGTAPATGAADCVHQVDGPAHQDGDTPAPRTEEAGPVDLLT